MARPIEPTPTLRGKDVERFFEEMWKDQHDPERIAKRKKFLKECDEAYERGGFKKVFCCRKI